MANCILEMLNALGIPNASLPKDGPVPGAQVIFTGKKGFGQGLTGRGWVEFTEANQLTQTSGEDGKATIDCRARSSGPDPGRRARLSAAPHHRRGGPGRG